MATSADILPFRRTLKDIALDLSDVRARIDESQRGLTDEDDAEWAKLAVLDTRRSELQSAAAAMFRAAHGFPMSTFLDVMS